MAGQPEEMLGAVSEAALVGTSETAVSRARSQYPTHPAHGPRAERVQIGRRLRGFIDDSGRPTDVARALDAVHVEAGRG